VSQRRDIDCPFCHTPLVVIEVHGHLQCDVCHNVVETCCEGAARTLLPSSDPLPLPQPFPAYETASEGLH